MYVRCCTISTRELCTSLTRTKLFLLTRALPETDCSGRRRPKVSALRRSVEILFMALWGDLETLLIARWGDLEVGVIAGCCWP